MRARRSFQWARAHAYCRAHLSYVLTSLWPWSIPASFRSRCSDRAAPDRTSACASAAADGDAAVGYADSPRVEVLTSTDLTRAYAADTTGVTNGQLSTVAWCRDGPSLLGRLHRHVPGLGIPRAAARLHRTRHCRLAAHGGSAIASW
jgi:hypothetical protein